jgi:hypothetical protein
MRVFVSAENTVFLGLAPTEFGTINGVDVPIEHLSVRESYDNIDINVNHSYTTFMPTLSLLDVAGQFLMFH